MNYNKTILLGRVTADPTYEKIGVKAIAKFSIATNRVWTDKRTGPHEETEYHKIVVYGGLADVVKKFVKKSSLVHVQGRIQTREWEKEGQKRSTKEIICEELQFHNEKDVRDIT